MKIVILFVTIFPSVRKMEAEVVRMTLKLFNGNEDCCGTVSICFEMQLFIFVCTQKVHKSFKKGGWGSERAPIVQIGKNISIAFKTTDITAEWKYILL